MAVQGEESRRLTLRQSRRGAAIYFLPVIAGAAFLAWQSWHEDGRVTLWVWISLGLGALGLAMCAASAFVWPATLEIDHEGFTWKGLLGLSQSCAWRDVADVGLATQKGLRRLNRQPAKTRIGIHYLPARAPKPLVASMNQGMYGYDQVIPNLWDLSSEALVEHLRDYLQASRRQIGGHET